MPGSQRRKRPWILELPERLGQLVSVVRTAADTPDGFARKIQMNFALEKGSRPVKATFTPDDARAAARALNEAADNADQESMLTGEGGEYPSHQWAKQ